MSAKGLSSRAIIGRYFMRLEQAPGLEWIGLISNYFTSDQESETYRWLGQVPQLREWIGGRQAKGFTENGITIENKHFEATLEILVREMRRDKTEQVMVRIDELADRTNAHWAKLLSFLIENGGSTVAYDGSFFFDTDHQEGKSGVQSNDITVDLSTVPVPTDQKGTPDNPSPEVMQFAMFAAIEAMYGFKDNEGEPLNENASDFLVMVPIKLWKSAQSAARAPVLSLGQTALARVMDAVNFAVVPNPRLSWTTQFAVFRTDGAIKSLIRQEEEPVQLKAIAEGSELEFREDKHHYGVDTWRNVGYGFWQRACRVNLTAT
ncbi:MAG TPA: Mu-like prophage major head subunit gpT family protein [Longimicrobiales bacterium]